MADPAKRYVPVTPSYPELGTDLVSVKHYTCPEYFERERTEIFEKTWVYLARPTSRKPGQRTASPFSIRSIR